MENVINKETTGHLGVICAMPTKRRRSHIRKLTQEQKKVILTSYKERYEEYQRKIAKD